MAMGIMIEVKWKLQILRDSANLNAMGPLQISVITRQ